MDLEQLLYSMIVVMFCYMIIAYDACFCWAFLFCLNTLIYNILRMRMSRKTRTRTMRIPLRNRNKKKMRKSSNVAKSHSVEKGGQRRKVFVKTMLFENLFVLCKWKENPLFIFYNRHRLGKLPCFFFLVVRKSCLDILLKLALSTCDARVN